MSAKKDSMPHSIKPMLAKLVAEPFDDPHWIFEVKWDGYRAIAEIEKGNINIYSRNGISFAHKYSPIVAALKKIKHDCVLDGEIVALKNGRSDFHSLQQYEEVKSPLQYIVFDILYLDGKDLRDQPLIERKKILKHVIPRNKTLVYSDHVVEKGKVFFKTVADKGLEGMVGKDASSLYQEGKRTGAWKKVKNQQAQEAIIVGFTEPRASRKYLGALVLAAHDRGKLTYIGHSGGGFTQQELKDLCAELREIKVKDSPLDVNIPVNAPVTWVKPKYVCEVQFTEWTPEGHMRHPIYKGLRVDKKPSQVRIERTEENKKTSKSYKLKAPSSFTHLDKIFWPEEGYTKGDLIDYYDTMADLILPYLKDRPENLNRHPNGWSGKNFFQKNFTAKLPDYVDTVKIWSESNQANLRYIVCNNRETLLYLANLGCIEINPWNSRVNSLHKPDYMIIDLDPGTNTFEEVIVVAQEVHTVLTLACEEHYPKTSGKTGLHIYVPLGADHDYDEVKEFCHLLMRIVNQRLPDLTSLERSPAKRKNKIYLDYLQNRFGQTIAAPYSLRPTKDATVSTPLEWGEVRRGLDPRKFTMKTIYRRLKQKGDLWKPVLKDKVDLKKSIKCLEDHLNT